MDFRSLLLSSIDRNKNKNLAAEPSPSKEDLFKKYYCEWKGINEEDAKKSDEEKKQIPKFFSKLPDEEDQLRLKLREESRAVFLQSKTRELLDSDELRNLFNLLESNQSAEGSSEDPLINYKDFLKVAQLAGPKCRPYFQPSVFCKLLQNDPHGRISITNFFSYVMRKVWVHQTRIGLSVYDVSGQGYLRESDLESYIVDLMPTLVQLNGLDKSFQSFYVCTAVRKFFFFLDTLHTGKIKIQDILTCNFLDDLLELRDNDLHKEQQQRNWFSCYSALKVYGIYLNLDKDHNGMLSKEELSKYGMGTLTKVFIDRVFQECLTYEGAMDYKTYLDFVLALENQKEPQALNYFFKILDIDGKGYLTTFDLNYFYRAIQEQMQEHGQEPISFENINDEIFDMVKPTDPTRITLKDLVNCGQGDVVTSILIDLNGFWTYENREAFGSDNSKDNASQV